ncbi:MAG TPA: ABC transporter substrate-binding protein [Chloroflexota bacterium]|nr:ABC transporter substrate-binding protein [Chloroflexota bacterium]
MHLLKPAAVLGLSVLLAACGGAAAPASSAPSSTATSAKPATAASTSAAASPAASTSAKPAASGSAAASSAAKPAASGLIKLVADYPNISGSNIPLYVTVEGGYFQKNGLDVDLQFINGAAKASAALLANQVQICHCGGTEAVNANAEGADLVVTGTLTPVYPYEFEVAPSIKTFNDLKGKPIGISSIGGAVDVVTRLVLRKNGLDPDKDVILVPDNGSTFRINAALGGATVAAMADPPGLLQLEAKGFHVLANPAADKLPTANSAVVVERGWLKDHGDVVQRYIDALIQGTARAKNDQPFALAAMKKYFKSDDEHAMQVTWDFFTKDVETLNPVSTPDQYTDIINELSKKNAKIKDMDVKSFLDNTFVQKAEQQGVAKNF